MTFSIFTGLCSYHHTLILKFFIIPKSNPTHLTFHPLYNLPYPPARPRQPLIFFLSLIYSVDSEYFL